MKSTSWKDIAELIGIAAIVASLIFVGLELQQSRAIAEANRQAQQMDREFGLTDLVSEHGALIVKINNGESLTEEEELVADRLIQAISTSYFFAYAQVNLLNVDGGRGVPVRSLAIFLNDNPGLKDRYIAQLDKINEANLVVRGRGLAGNSKAFSDEVVEFVFRLEEARR